MRLFKIEMQKTEKFKGWGSRIIQGFIPDVCFFSKIISERLLPAFNEALGDIENTSCQYESEWDESVDMYCQTELVRQGITNLYAVGLRHLYEQQISYLVLKVSRKKDRTAHYQKDEDYIESSEIDIKKFRSWQKIDELRLVSNAVKHAEGQSSKKLKEVRPDLFHDPEIAHLTTGSFFRNKSVHHPLFGYDIYLQESDIQNYAKAIEDFWNEFIETIESYRTS
jgi:hypothetical protein